MHITFFDLYSWEKDTIQTQLSEHALTLFSECISEESLKKVPDTEIISGFIYSSLGKKEIDMLPHLKMITTRSTGYDHIDLEYCASKGIVVCNVPFYGENTVAEHTFALILSLSRNVHKSYMRSLEDNFNIEGLMGFDLQGKKLGIIGAGKIGQHVIRIARGFGMEILAYDPYPSEYIAEALGFSYHSLDDVLQNADILSLHLPYTKETHHLIGKENISNMKPGAFIVNTARGGIIDTDALLAALENGHLAGAGLDVLEGEHTVMEEHELLSNTRTPEQMRELTRNLNIIHRDNVVFTPHIGFYSREALQRIIDTTIQNIQTFEKGSPQNTIAYKE